MTAREPAMRTQRRAPAALLALVLFAATFAVFSRTLGHGFTLYDDDLYVTENPRVLSGLTAGGVVWAFTTTENYNWHPLTWLSHMIDVQVYGLGPFGHHLTSVLLHAANAALLLLALWRMTGDVWPSALVAALFAVHPLHVESVAWIAERKDLLCAFFMMLTLLAYLAYARRPMAGRYVLVVLLYAAGLMAKPMLVTLPFVLLLLDYWPLRRLGQAEPRPLAAAAFGHHGDSESPTRALSRLPRLLLEKTPLLGLAAASAFVTFLAQSRGGAVSSLERLPLTVRSANALVSYVGYCGKTLWPSSLSFFYPHPGARLSTTAVAASGLALASLSLLALYVRKRRSYATVGWFWYMGMLVPVIGLVQVGPQAMADRYTYLPLIGLFIAGAWGLRDLAVALRVRARVLVAGAALVLPALALASWTQMDHWRDSDSLFRRALAVTSDNWLAHNNLGAALYKGGRPAEAAAHYRESIRLNPINEQAHVNLGVVLTERGEVDAAIAEFQEAARLNPGNAMAQYNLGVTKGLKGLRDEAIAHYREALRLKPNLTRAHNNLAGYLFDRGEIDQAIEHFRSALDSDPRNARLHLNLGIALLRRSDVDEAVSHFREATRLNPDDPEAREHLERALARGR